MSQRQRAAIPAGDLPSTPSPTRTSSIFPYSTVRPPTNYSAHSWVHGLADSKPNIPRVAPLPDIHESTEPSTIDSSEGKADDTAALPYDQQETPTYTLSILRGATTGNRVAGKVGGVTGQIGGDDGGVGLERGGWLDSDPASQAESKSRETGLEPVTAWSRESWVDGGLSQMGKLADTQEVTKRSRRQSSASDRRTLGTAQVVTRENSAVARERQQPVTRHSSLPSVLDLEQLAAYRVSKYKSCLTPVFPTSITQGVIASRAGYPAPPTPAVTKKWEEHGGTTTTTHLLSPRKQTKLGRMSMASARDLRSVIVMQRQDRPSVPPRSTPPPTLIRGWLKVRRGFNTAAPFVRAGLTLISALILTAAALLGSSLNTLVAVPAGTFTVSDAGDVNVALGVGGWCQTGVSTPTCAQYTDGDFANSEASFTVPGSSIVGIVSGLYYATLALTWFLASFLTVTAFLHFYLFFALSIPYDHLSERVKGSARGKSKMGKAHAAIVQEVDLRLRCERPPYDSCAWVWWAWWAHRKSPLAPGCALLVGTLSLSSVIAIIEFKREISNATGISTVSLGAGAYMPLLSFLLTLEPFIAAVFYWASFPHSWSTFTCPPDPSTGALLGLPSKPMRHIQPNSGTSFFAQPGPPLVDANQPGYLDKVPSSTPKAELDDETRRWLLAYPEDSTLVPLLNSLRRGELNDDFILSSTGLLYLRPGEGNDPARLVPPAGQVRAELVQDAHADADSHDRGHATYEEMMSLLEETFWWIDIERDVETFIAHCPICVSGYESRHSSRIVERFDSEGWTSVTLTDDDVGMTQKVGTAWTTGGESAMAADLAYDMSKADHQAVI